MTLGPAGRVRSEPNQGLRYGKAVADAETLGLAMLHDPRG